MGAPIKRLVAAIATLALAAGTCTLADSASVDVWAASPPKAPLSHSDVTPGLGRADRIRPTNPNQRIDVAVSLALPDVAGLDAFIASVSDPRSRHYGQYLTPAQFAARFSPAPAAVQAVTDHLRANGLTVSSVSANRMIVDAAGPASAIASAFGVNLYDWHDRDQNRDFYGNDSQPVLPASIAPLVVGIAGLNNHYQLQRIARPSLGPAPMAACLTPCGGFTPPDLRGAYDVTPLEGVLPATGERLGLFELDIFDQTHIATYDRQFGLLTTPPSIQPVDGGGRASGEQIEVELDIEVMHALAPSSPITVWEGPNTDQGALDVYNAMVLSDTTPANSTSWGVCEPYTTLSDVDALNSVFMQAAAQGQSFFAASGDGGAYDCSRATPPTGTATFTGLAVDNPADEPDVTGVGGTSLSLASGGGYGSEQAWSNTSRSDGSGGGLSTYFARPGWQSGPGVQKSNSTGMRQVPDVSLDADPATGYAIYSKLNGVDGWYVVGGTSAAAPSWAAITTLVDGYQGSKGAPRLGFANPRLYQLGSTAAQVYHDITTGNNLYYSATPGWDFATGWGSVDAWRFARQLVTLGAPGPLTRTVARPAGRSPAPAVPQASPGSSRAPLTARASSGAAVPSGMQAPQSPAVGSSSATTPASAAAVPPALVAGIDRQANAMLRRLMSIF